MGIKKENKYNMMRYSFSDFLNYQNELNNKYDEQKVNHMIDCFLKQLKRHIEKWPTSHTCFCHFCSKDFDNFYSIPECSIKEIETIQKYFEEMGFDVQRCSHDKENDPYQINTLTLTW